MIIKETAVLVIAAFLISLCSFAQKEGSGVVAKMNGLLLSNNISNTFYNTTTKTIEHNEYIVPVMHDVVLQTGTVNHRPVVKLYYQNGTGVKKKGDKIFQRAYWEFAFKSKKDAKLFIGLFKQLGA
jgi:hypothetical protein